MTEASRLRATIYVAGLESSVDDRTLADAFLPFGEIVDITIPKSENSSSQDSHRGFGYVEFEMPVDADEAIYNMDQSELFGRIIKVAHANPQKESNEGLGSKRAVWEQEGYLTKHGVSDEDKEISKPGGNTIEHNSPIPMQILEGRDVAGPLSA